MALTASTMLPLGTAAPEFALPNVVNHETVRRSDFANASALLVIFLCRHCPYVIHVCEELARLGQDYVPRGVSIVGISSNDAGRYPEDAPEKLAAMAREAAFNFPICYDETQQVARAFAAVCTPEFYLFDQGHRLVYRGQLDDSRPGRGEANGRELCAALNAVLNGEPVNPVQSPGIGCSIKWKPDFGA